MDLFQNIANDEYQSRLDITATKLAILFCEEKDIPKQFQKGLIKQSKSGEDTVVMKKFKLNVAHWKTLITTMLEKIEPEFAWRFINLTPIIMEEGKSFSQNEDFIKFTDYFIKRRNIENCNAEELGRLAQLHTAFQNIIENGK